ncbi:MAG: ankyrin repeat domain-containing protein [Polyangiales bacterium]
MSNSTLFSAIERADLAAVQSALDSGADANAVNDKGRTALIEAAARRDVSIVRLLLARGAEVDRPAHTRTALSVACQLGGYREERAKLEPAALAVIDALLEAKADVNASHAKSEYPPLVAALRWGTSAIVQRLLEARPKVDPSMVQLAIDSGEYSLVQPLITRAGGVDRTAVLRHLCEHGGRSETLANIARTLCKLGAKPNHATRDGVTATHWAAYWADITMLLVLIEAGADMNAKTTASWYANESTVAAGATPRTLLDRRVEFARDEEWERGDQSTRDAWEKLASALGTTVDQWLSELAAQRAQSNTKKSKATKSAKKAQ